MSEIPLNQRKQLAKGGEAASGRSVQSSPDFRSFFDGQSIEVILGPAVPKSKRELVKSYYRGVYILYSL